jgi:hypothetical protein
MSDETMQEVIVEINIIQEHYISGNYLKAYEVMHRLCCDNQHCEEFSQAAMSILSQYNDLENSITTINMELSQQELRKRQICNAFGTLISQMKRRFNPQQNSAYEEQAMRMKEHRNMLRKSLMAVEDDIDDCDNPKKTELLEQIKKQLREMIEYFRNLMTSFRAVKNYE